jgi:hypothetical protein
MRKVNEAQDAVNHRVAQGDERENRAEGNAIEQLLKKFGQKS